MDRLVFRIAQSSRLIGSLYLGAEAMHESRLYRHAPTLSIDPSSPIHNDPSRQSIHFRREPYTPHLIARCRSSTRALRAHPVIHSTRPVPIRSSSSKIPTDPSLDVHRSRFYLLCEAVQALDLSSHQPAKPLPFEGPHRPVGQLAQPHRLAATCLYQARHDNFKRCRRQLLGPPFPNDHHSEDAASRHP